MLDDFHSPPLIMFHFPKEESVSCGGLSSVLHHVQLCGVSEVCFHCPPCDTTWYVAGLPLLPLWHLPIHSSSKLPEKQLGVTFFFTTHIDCIEFELTRSIGLVLAP